MSWFAAAAATFLLSGSLDVSAAQIEPWELRSGDRVALLGGTFIEREQSYGYWEAAVVSRFPGRKVSVRNLGWSGDTVWGESRAGFGGPADGFEQLRRHVADVKPTTIVVAYGANEAFAGPAGLHDFTRSLERLLDVISRGKPALVLLSPLRHEALPPPLPDPASRNADLAIYSRSIEEVARGRGIPFVDLSDFIEGEQAAHQRPLTDNGMHLSEEGYWRTAPRWERALGFAERLWRVSIEAGPRANQTTGTSLSALAWSTRGVTFRLQDELLPLPPPPRQASVGEFLSSRVLRVAGLPAGRYLLRVDGNPLTDGTADDWARGVSLPVGPEHAQAELLRTKIVWKNQLYFHRYRPQNETYLFGFRKHEQGNNAAEIPRFDPLIAAEELVIWRLSVPAPHQYALERASTP